MKNKKMKNKRILKTTLLTSLLLGCTSLTTLTGCGKDELTITLEAGDVTTVHPGDTIQLTSKVSDAEVGLPMYEIVEGSEYATVSASGVLTISENAPNNTTIKIKAKIGKTASNEISVKVEVVEATAVAISTTGSVSDLERNQDVLINSVVTPNNATNQAVTYAITEGEEYATLSATGLLKVKAGAPIGATIKVKATLGTLQSNELTFTVVETAESEFDVSLNNGNVTIDSTSNQASYTLNPTAYDADGIVIQNATFAYQVMEGAEYVSVSSTGVITSIGHGQARVRAKVDGSNAYADCTVNSIVPPKTIELEEEYEGKTRYGFGRSEAMSFDVTGVGTTNNQPVANTYKYEFFLDDAVEADATLATYNATNKTISFADKTVGHKVKIVVTSDTGASKETTRNFTVEVNNGVNVHNMSELIALNNGENVKINLVGDCVVTNEEVVAANTLSAYLLRFNKDFTLYGNGHKIDFSDVEIVYGRDAGGETFIYVDNSLNSTNNTVKIYNLDMVGNVGVDAQYSQQGQSPATGGFHRGLRIKGADKNNVLAYLSSTSQFKPGHTIIDMDDVKISGFRVGMMIEHAIESNVKNITLENNLQGGAEITASILTFENVNIGKNGTSGIELTPDECYAAGFNFNAPQTITFKGKVNCTNDNDFHTQYVNNDTVLKMVQEGLGDIIANQVEEEYQQLVYKFNENANDSLNWFLLVFSNPYSTLADERNNKTVIYFQEENGTYKDVKSEICDVNMPESEYSQIKFVSVNIDASTILGAGANLGKIVVVNQQYNK